MGVTGLWKLIEQSGTPVPPETLENKILAIDVSIWLHQAVKGYQDSSGAALPHAHLLSLFGRVCKLLHYRIKPVFVFDGGVPYLKRETIRKRAQNKSKFRSQAERLQKLLAESVEREKLLRHALGNPDQPSTSASPQKSVSALPTDAGRDAMFILPPLPESAPEASGSEAANTFNTSLNESTQSDESHCSATNNAYNIDLASIDVTGKHFLGLPADVRHEILTDLKAMRKESSWGRLHELPEQRDEFSSFQMRRLLKRRQVQQSLEQAEQEMGGSSLSLAEIERLLREEGVVAADEMGAMAKKRVISDENKRILHVSSLREALREEKRAAKQEAKKLDVKVEESGASPPKMAKVEVIDLGDDDEEQQLQLAIEMSLQGECGESHPAKTEADSPELGTEFDAELQAAIQMSLKQGEVQEISSSDEGDGVSSNADSDFVEVPDATGDEDLDNSFMRHSQLSFETNVAPPPSASMDFRHEDLKLQVVIDPLKIGAGVDDLFADVFGSEKEQEKNETIKEAIEVQTNVDKYQENVNEISDFVLKQEERSIDLVADVATNAENDKEEVKEVVPKPEVSNVLEAKTEKEEPRTEIQMPPKPDASRLDSILDRLNMEMQSLVQKNEAQTIKTESTSPPKTKQSEITAFVTVTPTKTKPPATPTDTTPPPKVASPFFRKKTPQSSGFKDATLKPTASPNSSAKKSLQFAEAEQPTAAELLANAASQLRDANTTEELSAMAATSRQNTRDLMAERNKQDRLGVSITERMSEDCQQLLRLFGIPFVVAPMEAEAQCAALNAAQLTDGTITDDSDIWLFGGRTVYRHFFDQDKRVLEFRAEEVHRMFRVERGTLIQMAMLVGSDYTTGVPGIGTVTALEILSAFPTEKPTATDKTEQPEAVSETALLAGLQRFRDWFAKSATTSATNRALRQKLRKIELTEGFPRAQIVQGYLQPEVRDDLAEFSWRAPDAESLREFAKTTFGWTFARTDETLGPVLKRLQEKRGQQQTIRNYFATQQRIDRREVTVSKRMRKAIEQMSQKKPAGDAEAEEEEAEEPVAAAKTRRTRKTKAAEVSDAAETDCQPSTSKRAARATRAATKTTTPTKSAKVTARIPSSRSAATIPQRQKADAEQKERKAKAAEVLKQSLAAAKKGK